MPKLKTKIKPKKNNYFSLTIGIFISLIVILTIGRVGQSKYIGLIFAIIFGDYSIIVLIFLLIYSILGLVLNHKFDFHHIYFIGSIFIFFGLSLFSHLNIYDNMDDSNLLSFTFKLYGRYFTNYNYTYSTGGGIVGAVLALAASFIAGRLGIILLAICFIIVGFSYLLDVKIIKLLKGGKLRSQLRLILSKGNNFFSNIHVPSYSTPVLKPSILKDSDEIINFTLQEEINKELLIELRKYIQDNRLYCVCDTFYTSYTSSRYILKLAHKSDDIIKELKHFFNRRCFIIKNNLEISIEISNSFKKLLSLKSTLIYNDYKNTFLALDVSNEPICIDFTSGRLLTVIGDYTSGVKTFIRSLLSSLVFGGYSPKNIYLFDLYKEYEQICGSINYIYSDRDILFSLDEGFNEYERRNETLRYLDCDNIIEANKKIKELDGNLSIIETKLYFISLNPKSLGELAYSKIAYLIKFGLRVGINVVLIVRDINVLSRINIQNSDIVSFYLSEISSSIKLFGSDVASRLQKKGDVIIQSNSKIRHGQAPYISLEDFENVFKHL